MLDEIQLISDTSDQFMNKIPISNKMWLVSLQTHHTGPDRENLMSFSSNLPSMLEKDQYPAAL